MSAWANLLAASQLALGTAWDLLTHPKTGGSISFGEVILLKDTGTIIYTAITPNIISTEKIATNIIAYNPVYTLVRDTPTNTNIISREASIYSIETTSSSIFITYSKE